MIVLPDMLETIFSPMSGACIFTTLMTFTHTHTHTQTHTVDHIEVATLQEALHQSGIHSLGRFDPVPLSQLRSFITEMYSCLKVQKPSLGANKLQQAQELFFNWCQMVYLTSTGGYIPSGSLKILLCLLSGTKPFDKARSECN